MRPLRVLIVDDNRADVSLLRQGFKLADIPVDVLVASDGDEALALLLSRDAPRPDLMLLDINMPRVSGHDVLRRLKEHDDLRAIVVLMFTSSSADWDVETAYARGANGYIKKPNDLDAFIVLAHAVAGFWGRWASLPPRRFPDANAAMNRAAL